MKPRPTEAEFDELKRKRDLAVGQAVAEIAKKWGVEASSLHVHTTLSAITNALIWETKNASRLAL